MGVRIIVLVLAVALSAAACGGDDTSDGGTTGGTGTGATGATGSVELGKFTTAVQDAEGDSMLSFSGISCDGLAGPYVVTIAVEGNLSGETTATLDFTDGSTGILEWSMEVSGAEEGTLSGRYAAELSPLQDVGIIVFSGVTTAESVSGTRTFDVETGDVPVDVGTGTCPNP